MRVYHPSLRSTTVGSSKGVASVDVEGYAEVSDELGAHLLKIDFVAARGAKADTVAAVAGVVEPKPKVTFAPMVEEKMLTSETEVPEPPPSQQELLISVASSSGEIVTQPIIATVPLEPVHPLHGVTYELAKALQPSQAVIDEVNRISAVQSSLMVSISPSAEAVQAAFEKANQSGSPTAVVGSPSREATSEEIEAFISLSGEAVREVGRKTIHEGLVELLTEYLEQTKVKSSSISKVAERLLGLLEGNEETTPDQADEPESEDPEALQKLRLRHASIAAALKKSVPKKPAKK